MTDYDAEIGRGAKGNGVGRAFELRRAPRALEQYAALEYPRESATWLRKTAESAPDPSPSSSAEQVPEGVAPSRTDPRRARSDA